MTEKTKPSFTQQAARASWIVPLAGTLIVGIGTSALKTSTSPIGGLILGATFLLMLVAGIVLGIIGCFGAKTYSLRSTLVPGIIGIVVSGLILFVVLSVAVSSYNAARTRPMQERQQSSNQPFDRAR